MFFSVRDARSIPDRTADSNPSGDSDVISVIFATDMLVPPVKPTNGATRVPARAPRFGTYASRRMGRVSLPTRRSRPATFPERRRAIRRRLPATHNSTHGVRQVVPECILAHHDGIHLRRGCH